MQNNSRCVDSYSTTFDSFPMMLGYHKELSQNSEWTQCPIKELGVEPLDRGRRPLQIWICLQKA